MKHINITLTDENYVDLMTAIRHHAEENGRIAHDYPKNKEYAEIKTNLINIYNDILKSVKEI